MSPRARSKLGLYWCWTDDHHEDWFVVAPRARDARRFFENAEGYDHSAESRRVVTLPDELQGTAKLGWPDEDVLTACGARHLRDESPRVVELNGERFAEGMLQHELDRLVDDVIERRGQGRPNRTTRTRPV
jgi:hypothetical protein